MTKFLLKHPTEKLKFFPQHKLSPPKPTENTMEIEKGQFDPTQTETNDPPCGLLEKTKPKYHKQTKEKPKP